MSSIVLTPVRPAPATPERALRPRASWRAALSSRVYVPALAVPAVAVALLAIGWAGNWGGLDFSESVKKLHLVVAGPVSVAVLGCILVLERIRPAQRRPLVARGHRHDVL